MCYQHSHFIDEKTEARGINEVTSKWKRCFFGDHIHVYLVNYVGKGTVYLDWWGKDLDFNSTYKIKNKIKYVT